MTVVVRRALCDPEAVSPLRRLVLGPLLSPSDLIALEYVLRGIVLHDEMTVQNRPVAFDPVKLPWPPRPGTLGLSAPWIAPKVDGIENLLSVRQVQASDTPLSPAMLSLAARLSNAQPGNPYYDAHVEFMKNTLGTVAAGGSAVCIGAVWAAIDKEATSFPHYLFDSLDKDWAEYARAADAGTLGPTVPPVLSIVLTRAASRDRIATIIADLRDEWAGARAKVWALVDEMKRAQTARESNEVLRQLDDASKQFSPKARDDASRPLRVLWEVVAKAGSGALTATLAGGDAVTGAVAGGAQEAARAAAQVLPTSWGALMHRGAYDLAARVRRSTAAVEPMPALLARFLTDAEKRALGF